MSESTTFSHTDRPHRLAYPPGEINVVAPPSLIDTAHVGYSKTLLYDDTIYAFHLTNLERCTLDALLYHMYDTRIGWVDLTRPKFLMVTFDESIVTITPYAREKAYEMNSLRPDVPLMVAVVVPNSAVGQLLKVLIWGLSQTWQATTLHIFVDADEALTWLKRQVDYATPRSTSV